VTLPETNLAREVLEQRLADLVSENAHLASENSQLQSRVEELQDHVQRQGQRLGQLERQLAASKKNSSNSSKPPSGDIVKRPKSRKRRGKKRKRGAQPGHPMHERAPLGPEAIARPHEHRLETCPCCGERLEPTENDPRIFQKIDLIQQPQWAAEEHRTHASRCPRCQQVYQAPLPAHVERGGLLGPGVLSLIAYLKGVCHCSFSTIRKVLRDMMGLTISRGRLSKAVAQVSEALRRAYEQLKRELAWAELLNVDETGHKDNGQRHWTWCFRSPQFTCFHISPSRGSAVLLEVLGEQFDGVLGCDYFSAYRKFMKETPALVQFCLAHLIRDVRYLATLPDRPTAAYGQRLVEAIRKLFEVIHLGEFRSDQWMRKNLARQREAIIEAATTLVPQTREGQAIARRFEKHGEAYFQFLTTPGLEPTNNLAEQAIRFVVIDRRVTQGTRGQTGLRWSERIWTVIATCAQQGRSVLEFLQETVTAWVHGQPPPSLVPAMASAGPPRAGPSPPDP
jgi:transposase